MEKPIILRYVKIGLQGFLNFFRKKPIAGAKQSKSGIKIVLGETDFTKIHSSFPIILRGEEIERILSYHRQRPAMIR
ncbi:MAG: hypothetical protein WKF91_05290 [Segetibacter sp.]